MGISDKVTLPRVLYFSDVPIEATMFQGAGLVYRLLEDYPPDRLLAIETKQTSATAEKRLPGVAYRKFAMSGNRWRYTRLSHYVGSWMLLGASRHARRLRGALGGFSPDAVLTLTFGYSWLVAARFAEFEKLPLHLISHDDWLPTMHVLRGLRSRQDDAFRTAYQYASSRLCVSPFMEEEYRRMYGVPGQVLYPSWGKDVPPLPNKPRAYGNHAEPLVGAYAGNIFRPGYTQLIVSLAERLEARGGRLLLFGPYSTKELNSCGLQRNSVRALGVAGPTEMLSRIRAEADFAFVPMSFESGSLERNMRISFPSKLTDCTVAGLPLLIWGPEYCSAVRWAQRYAPVAEVVTSLAKEDVDTALCRLEQPQHRERLGKAAREVGDRLFSNRVAKQTFYKALMGGSKIEQNECAYDKAR